jgi:hypothetical protein
MRRLSFCPGNFTHFMWIVLQYSIYFASHIYYYFAYFTSNNITFFFKAWQVRRIWWSKSGGWSQLADVWWGVAVHTHFRIYTHSLISYTHPLSRYHIALLSKKYNISATEESLLFFKRTKSEWISLQSN